MKCPACFNELTQIQVGTLVVDACKGGCGGIWFDAFELQKVDEEHEVTGEPLLNLPRDERVKVDKSRKRACPRCLDMKLHRHFFSSRRQVEVDHCPNCGGYWLDHGELALIRAEHQVMAQSEESRPGISAEVIRYLYPLQSGQ